MSHRGYAVCLSTTWYHLTCVMLNIRSRGRHTAAVDKRVAARAREPTSDGGLSNGFDVTDATYSNQWSIGWLREDHVVPPDVCDGHEPARSM